MFQVAAMIAVDKQGPDSISRWGVVSNNSIMTEWSSRMGLKGPEIFRRYSAPASETPVLPLPDGFSFREAVREDLENVMSAAQGLNESFTVALGAYGTQNWIIHGWGDYTVDVYTAGITHEMTKGQPTPSPWLLLDKDGVMIGFAHLAIRVFGSNSFAGEKPSRVLLFGYCDGTTEGLKLIYNLLPSLAPTYDCHIAMGYIPCDGEMPLPSVILEESPAYSRATSTEQWEYTWANADHANAPARPSF